MRGDPGAEVDLAGVGFGPSHLAMAALHASPARAGRGPASLHFLEGRPGFSWHGEMLLPGAVMQVAFAKDLVTPLDPTSPFSFLNYLVRHDRLESFLNLQTFTPTREEFSDYLGWAAAQLGRYVTYGAVVRSVRGVEAGGRVRSLEVGYEGADGVARTLRARNVSIATGGRPVIPDGVEPGAVSGGAVTHSSDFLRWIRAFRDRGPGRASRFLVVGAGQSAAEIVQYLHREFPASRQTLAHRGFSLQPANDSPLANAIFDPASVDLFYRASDGLREDIMRSLRTTNYAAVDGPDIQSLAEILYTEQVTGRRRLEVSRFSALERCSPARGLVEVVLLDQLTGERRVELFDGVVLATGYDFGVPPGLLDDLEPYLRRDDRGRYLLRRDYGIDADDRLVPRVFLHGAAEHTHGLTSALLSLVARKAGTVMDAVAAGSPPVPPVPVPAGPRTEAARTETARTETARPEATRPEATRPEAARTEPAGQGAPS